MGIDPTNIEKRMRVFNGQLFDSILKNHTKVTKDYQVAFMKRNFNNLFHKACDDDNVTFYGLHKFVEKYESNMKLLSEKDLSEKD